MATARYWDSRRLLLTLFSLLVAFGVFRWSMVAGIYQATIENQQVTRLAGLWTPAFASMATAVAAAATLLTLIWITCAWFAGRHDRRAREASESAGHRRVLM